MSEENVEIVRAMYEPLARGDFSAWADFSDDFEFVASPELPDAGTYRGEAAISMDDGVGEFLRRAHDRGTEIIDAGGDKVFVAILQGGRPGGSQTVVEGRWWVVMTLRGSELAWAEVFPERA